MAFGVRDKRVIEAFIRHERADAQKLSTDGERLDGHWIGGNGLAEWIGGSIHFSDPGGIIGQRVQRMVRNAAKRKHQNPTFWIKGALKNHKRGSLHRSAHVPMGQKIPMSTVERLTHSRSAKTRKRAVLARTLRSLGRRTRRR
jgi:hypothetical protein